MALIDEFNKREPSPEEKFTTKLNLKKSRLLKLNSNLHQYKGQKVYATETEPQIRLTLSNKRILSATGN